jgi:hypothetical protein
MATTFAVPDGRVAMAATTYTGTGAILAVSNAVNAVSFQPDLVWIKSRGQARSHRLQDVIRGVGVRLSSDLTDADTTDASSLTAFNSNGFSLGTNVNYNTSAETFVAWNWKAGGTVTAGNNTAGTITSTVSANTTAGFSVVTYTGTGANATVGHGLGIAPAFIIFKGRTNVSNWWCYHSGLTSAAYTISLNQTAAQSNSPTSFQSTAPALTVFSIGTDGGTNSTAIPTVAYCWAPVAGYSAFGSYTGNSSADGPFIYTGFRPRWLMIKEITVGGTPWMVWDSSRDTYNPEAARLTPNLSDAEVSVSIGDFVSNGIKIRQTGTSYNATGSTYIYAAFAENPLKYANAR